MTDTTNKAYYFDLKLSNPLETLCLWEVEVLLEDFPPPSSNSGKQYSRRAQIRKIRPLWSHSGKFELFEVFVKLPFFIHQQELLFTQEDINKQFAKIVENSTKLLKELITIDTQNVGCYTRKLETIQAQLDKEYQDIVDLSKMQPPTIKKEI
jgi:hypothetical protein